MFSHREANGTRQLVAVAFNEGGEGLVSVELGIQVLWNGSIERCGGLVATTDVLWSLYRTWLSTLYHLRQLVLLVCNNTVCKLGAFSETACQHLA